ncbi:MAG: coenzyme F420-0:L-glutamate ligase [Candidatus Bathyarchaeia archaeon]
MAKTVSIIALEKIPLIKRGDDLARIIVQASLDEGVTIEDGDVVVVSQKIVSKAEGRTIRLQEVETSIEDESLAKETRKDPRLIKLIRNESNHMFRSITGVIVVQDRRGMTCVNAGLDKSNVEGEDSYTLLPLDPDESAEKIRRGIKELTGASLAVIVCDTASRPFRRGQVEFAIGLAGMNPFKDYRGEKDLFGYTMRVKNVALADEIAAAAELVIGQGREATPVAIVKNVERLQLSENHSAKDLFSFIFQDKEVLG